MNPKKIILFCGLVLAATALWAEGIAWIESYDAAFKKAAQTGKPVLVLITAPSWCGWCKKFEADVLSSKEVQAQVTRDFVPLLVLDTNEKDIAKFDFDGFPTVRVYDSKVKELADVYVLDPKQFMSLLKPFAKAGAASGNTGSSGAQASGDLPPPPAFDAADILVKFTFGASYFAQLSDGRWQYCDDSGTCTLLKSSDKGNNNDFYMLYGMCDKAGKEAWMSIPKNGGKSFYYDESKKKWMDLYPLTLSE